MMQNNDYRFSFFKPTTKEARVNRNLTLILVIVWAVCIFGFQFLLKFTGKVTPEPSYTNYAMVMQNVESNNATTEELQIYSKSVLSVLGKVMLNPKDRPALDQAVNAAFYKLVPDSLRAIALKDIEQFEALKSNLTSLNDSTYKKEKASFIAKYAAYFNLQPFSIEAKLLPLELKSAMFNELPADSKVNIAKIMKKYTHHNRSVLTDTIFLGFPFHYFYTAVFLLILFLGLCWIYCLRIDQVNKMLGIDE